MVEKLPQPTPCRIQLISRFHTDEEKSSEEKYGGEEFGFCMRDLYSPTLCVCGLTCGDFQQPDLITRLFWFGYRLKPLLFLIKAATDCNCAAPACDDSNHHTGEMITSNVVDGESLRFSITPELSRQIKISVC